MPLGILNRIESSFGTNGSVRAMQFLCLAALLLGVSAGALAQSGTYSNIIEYSTTSSGYPMGIATGSDGALWFTEFYGNRIGRITTTGALTEYPVPTADSQPQGIAAGSDGALWFTEFDAFKIGRITTDGAFTEYSVSTGKPNWIA